MPSRRTSRVHASESRTRSSGSFISTRSVGRVQITFTVVAVTASRSPRTKTTSARASTKENAFRGPFSTNSLVRRRFTTGLGTGPEAESRLVDLDDFVRPTGGRRRGRNGCDRRRRNRSFGGGGQLADHRRWHVPLAPPVPAAG